MRTRSIDALADERDCSGFALVEALASLVIVAMIGLMLVAGVATGRRVWERIDTREAAAEGLETAQTMLRDRIEQIYPATLYGAAAPRIDFQGDESGLNFLANPPEAGRPAPLRRYKLSLAASGDLILSSISDIEPAGSAAWNNQVILKGVRQVDVAYFAAAAPDGAGRWTDEWRDQSLLPEVIRIRVTFEPGDRRRWPDLLVRPRATVDTDCLLDPNDHHCRGRA